MHASTALFLAIAGSAAAQYSTTSAMMSVPTSESGCGSAVDDIISNCLTSTNIPLNNCATNDWDCMCSAQQSILQCYNNCPSDPARSAAESQQVAWCNAAHPFGTTTTSTGTAPTASSSSSGSSDADPTGSMTTGDDASPSSSGDAAAPTNTDSAAVVNVVPGVLVGLLGVVALL